jgi:hypothetical protein
LNSGRTPAIMTEVYHGFPQSFEVSAGIVSQLCHRQFHTLCNSLIYQPTNQRYTVCSPESVIKQHTKKLLNLLTEISCFNDGSVLMWILFPGDCIVLMYAVFP